MVQVCSETLECKVSVKRMWHGLFEDAHNCWPKALPLHIEGVEYPHHQLGFHLPGHERLIKLRKGLCEEVHEVEKHLHETKEEAAKAGEGVLHEAEKHVHKDEACVKEEVLKVGEAGKLAKEKAAKVVGAAEQQAHAAKEKVVEVVGGAKKEAHHVKKEAIGTARKAAQYAEKEVGCAVHEAAKLTGKVVKKEAEVVEKGVHAGEKVVGAVVQKVDAFLLGEELWIKEKIEEVDHEAHKIAISVTGGLVGILFGHCKHSFEFKEGPPGGACILLWTSEFETLSPPVHYFHPFEKLKQHALAPFHGVEAYLLKCDDYSH